MTAEHLGRRMTKPTWYYALITAVLVVGLALILWVGYTVKANRTACERKGGVYLDHTCVSGIQKVP